MKPSSFGFWPFQLSSWYKLRPQNSKLRRRTLNMHVMPATLEIEKSFYVRKKWLQSLQWLQSKWWSEKAGCLCFDLTCSSGMYLILPHWVVLEAPDRMCLPRVVAQTAVTSNKGQHTSWPIFPNLFEMLLQVGISTFAFCGPREACVAFPHSGHWNPQPFSSFSGVFQVTLQTPIHQLSGIHKRIPRLS